MLTQRQEGLECVREEVEGVGLILMGPGAAGGTGQLTSSSYIPSTYTHSPCGVDDYKVGRNGGQEEADGQESCQGV